MSKLMKSYERFRNNMNRQFFEDYYLKIGLENMLVILLSLNVYKDPCSVS